MCHFESTSETNKMAEDFMTMRIPADLKRKLKKLADAEKRSLGNYVKAILESHVQSKKK